MGTGQHAGVCGVGCYAPLMNNCFPTTMPKGEDDEGFIQAGDEFQFKKARNGDHLITPFQCDLCHFRSLKGRDLMLCVAEDKMLQIHIQWANLDAFWSREPKTVASNLQEAKKELMLEAELGLGNTFPYMGPFPLAGIFRMKLAVLTLMQSLSVGKYADCVQFDTMRKRHSTYSNVYHASTGATGMAIMAKDKARTFITSCPMYNNSC